ncbi:MAG: PAS domain S-box protein [Bacteroidia bacterium]
MHNILLQSADFENILDQLPAPVFITEKHNGNIAFINRACCMVMGKEKQQVKGIHYSEFLGLTGNEALINKIEVQLNQPEVLILDVFSQTASPQKEWQKFQLSRIDRLEKSLIIWTKETGYEKVNSDPQFKIFQGNYLFELDDSPQPVFGIDRLGKLFFANKRCCQLSGYSAEELYYRGLNILFKDAALNAATDTLRDCLQGYTRSIELSINPRSGTERNWSITAYPCKNDTNETAVICFVQDITLERSEESDSNTVIRLLDAMLKSTDLRASLNQLLDAMRLEIGADIGECWLHDYLRKTEKIFALAAPEYNSLQRFCDFSTTLEIPLEFTEPHRAGKTRGQIINLFIEENFSRRQLAVESGLNACLAIPVYSGDNHVATLVFFAVQHFNDELRAVRLIRLLAERLGVHIESRRIAYEADKIFELVPDFLCILDQSGRIYKLNTRFAELLGKSHTEIIGSSFFNWIDDEYVEASLSAFQKLQNEDEVTTENIIKNAEGKRMWLEWNLCANQQEGLIYAAGKDLTLRILYDEELRNQNERFRLLREATHEAIYDYDIPNDSYDWGDSFTKLTGHIIDKTQLNAEHWASFVHPGDLDRILNNRHAAILKKEKIWNEEYQYRCADNSYKHILDRGVVLYNDLGNAVRLIGTMQDITALKRSEETLIQLNDALQHRAQQLLGFNKELEQFAYIVSHDLQEPLRMISSFMKLLLNSKEITLNERSEQYINFALDGAERMKRLIQDLLTYSRVGTNEDDFTNLSLKEMVRETLLVYQQLIRERNAQISVGQLPEVKGIRSLIQQILDNLLSNALKYNDKPTPTIHFDCTETDTHHILSVKDNGIGIDPKSFDLIYLPFKRLHNKTEYSGTGIGLAVCKKITDKHTGKIWVESTLSLGSTFYISLHK